MATGHLEFDPNNGSCPHIVVIECKDGGHIKFAYTNRERAEVKLPDLIRGFTENGQ